MKEDLGFMKNDTFVTFLVRVILVFLAAATTTLFYNNTIAWNFNLPNIGFWEFVLGIWTIRFCKVAIWGSVKKDP